MPRNFGSPRALSSARYFRGGLLGPSAFLRCKQAFDDLAKARRLSGDKVSKHVFVRVSAQHRGRVLFSYEGDATANDKAENRLSEGNLR